MNSSICLSKQRKHDSRQKHKSLTDIAHIVHIIIKTSIGIIKNNSASLDEFLIFLFTFFIKKKSKSSSDEKNYYKNL